MFEFESVRITWRDILDIGLVAFVFYRVILLVKGTRAVSVIYGLLFILVVYFLSSELGFYTLNWLLANFLSSIFLVVIILFQQDIRRALADVGAGRLWRKPAAADKDLENIIGAALHLAQRRIGAIMVIEKSVGLGDYAEKGIHMDARISRDLLVSIFIPTTPLHDGAVLIKGNRIRAAACILPLAGGVTEHREFGTRHRAAMGITEETDAVAVVVSEERGEISIAVNGRVTRSLDAVRIKRVLTRALGLGGGSDRAR
ncbi:MAG: diadenylate cyclase CdaA [Desulfovibrionaceae bacterium]